MLRKHTGKSTKSSMVMAQNQRNQHTTLTMKEFTPLANKVEVQKDKRIRMDGMAPPTTKIKPTGARVSKTSNTRLTQMHPKLNLDMASHPKVPTPLNWVDTSLSVPRDKVILQLALKIPMTLNVAIESFS